jgi:Ca2+-binding EF-hand superfamily protein
MSHIKSRFNLDSIFDRYDKDKSGYLDFNEVKKLLSDARKKGGKGPASDDDVRKLLKCVDQNNDERLTKAELAKMFSIASLQSKKSI